MSDEFTCVQDTDYGEYFENAGENTVFLLSQNMAERTWNSEVHASTSSYFDLPDDCWIIASKSVPIGRWMEAYNNDENPMVEKSLRASVDWSDDIFIKFFAKKTSVFRVKWKDFLHYWDEFIAVEDDCPIVIPENESHKEAILFRPIGDIVKIG